MKTDMIACPQSAFLTHNPLLKTAVTSVIITNHRRIVSDWCLTEYYTSKMISGPSEEVLLLNIISLYCLNDGISNMDFLEFEILTLLQFEIT